MKQILYSIVLFSIMFLHIRSVSSVAISAAPWRANDLAFCTAVDSSKHFYRSAQPTAMELDSLLETKLIKTVIRFNGEGSKRERGALYHAQERAQCPEGEVKFLYVNLDANKYGTEAWDSTITYVLDIVEDGHALIHCRNNMHRAGLIAGLYQAKQGKSWDDILDANKWRELAQMPGQYLRYVEPVYLAAQQNELKPAGW